MANTKNQISKKLKAKKTLLRHCLEFSICVLFGIWFLDFGSYRLIKK